MIIGPALPDEFDLLHSVRLEAPKLFSIYSASALPASLRTADAHLSIRNPFEVRTPSVQPSVSPKSTPSFITSSRPVLSISVDVRQGLRNISTTLSRLSTNALPLLQYT